MGSKVIPFLGFFLAMVLLISPEVAAARELAQTYNTVGTFEETKGVVKYDRNLQQYNPPGGGGYRPPGGGGYRPPGGGGYRPPGGGYRPPGGGYRPPCCT